MSSTQSPHDSGTPLDAGCNTDHVWSATADDAHFYDDSLAYIGDIIDPHSFTSPFMADETTGTSPQLEGFANEFQWLAQSPQAVPQNSLLFSSSGPTQPSGLYTQEEVGTADYYSSNDDYGIGISSTPNESRSGVPAIRIDTTRLVPAPTTDYFGAINYAQARGLSSASPSTAGSASFTLPTPFSMTPLHNALVVDGSPVSSSDYNHTFGNYMAKTATPYPMSPAYSPTYSPSDAPSSIYDNRRSTVGSGHLTVAEIAQRFPSHGTVIPQRTYRPHTQSDRRRYVDEVELEEPIMFFSRSSHGCGILCRDALTSKFMDLLDRDDQMFINRGPSVSIRLMWPGYAPWSRQIPTRDFKSPPGPITRSKLAKNVAKTVHRFIDEMKTRQLEDDADPRWRVGPRHICIEHLELIGLQHVSMGSWQCHLRLRPQT